jgi:hypothetical protein
MTRAKPKSSVLISIGMVVLAILVSDLWLFYGLIRYPETYFWWKLILTPTLFVLAISITRKGYISSIQLTIGNNQLTYKYFLGPSKTYKISEINYWREEVVKSKKTDYKRLTIVFVNGRSIQLSNQEHSDYPAVINYIKKKVIRSSK